MYSGLCNRLIKSVPEKWSYEIADYQALSATIIFDVLSISNDIYADLRSNAPGR